MVTSAIGITFRKPTFHINANFYHDNVSAEKNLKEHKVINIFQGRSNKRTKLKFLPNIVIGLPNEKTSIVIEFNSTSITNVDISSGLSDFDCVIIWFSRNRYHVDKLSLDSNKCVCSECRIKECFVEIKMAIKNKKRRPILLFTYLFQIYSTQVFHGSVSFRLFVLVYGTRTKKFPSRI